MAEKKGFDLAAVLGDVSKLDTAREQIEYIDIDLIDSDDRNFYQLTELESLAANIELIGLQQPIRIRKHPEDAGRYIIVSGHRRRAALQLLVSEGKEKFREVPCIQEQGAVSAAMQELMLIYANSDTRRMGPAEVAKQVERVEALLYQLKEEGIEFPGRMRDHVAEACKVSKTKIARLKVIQEGLLSDFKEPFEKQKISENVAYILARLPEEFQHRLFRVMPPERLNGTALEKMAEKYAAGWRWETDMCCPNGKPCGHADAAMRHDMADHWNMCGGTKCCLNCPAATRDWSPCSNACSKAKAKKAEQSTAEKEKVNEERRRTTNRYQRITQENASRLLPVIDAAQLPENTLLPFGEYGSGYTVKEVRAFANGEFKENESWYSEKISQEKIREVKKLAQKLNCSTDFLLALTDDPRPSGADAAAWVSCEQLPPKPCEVVADFELEGEEIRKLCWFDGDGFRFSRSGASIDLQPVRWFAVPAVEVSK